MTAAANRASHEDAKLWAGQAQSALHAFSSAGIADPAELPPLASFARTSEIYHAALTKLRRTQGEHARFSATHDDDDPAHQEHQERVARARQTLTTAERAFVAALIAWREARGLAPEVTP